MQQYLVRRLLLAVPTLVGVTVIIFVAMRILPGDPVAAIFGEGTSVYVLSEKDLMAARHSLGLDRPLHVQYLSWMGDVLKGDLGKSFWRDEPIREVIQRRAPITVQIALMALIMSWIVGVPVGVLCAMRRNSVLDYIVRTIVTLFMAIPNFWLGLTFILLVVSLFSWRPSMTIVYLWDDPLRNMEMTIGPAVALGLGLAAVIARMSRATLLEVLREDYVRTARSKGLGERLVVWRHVLRNSLLPVVTVSGLQFGALLGGSVAVERAFSVPGLGFALVQGIGERDWMMIQNLVLLFGVVSVFIALAVDLTYAWIDPRIRYR